MHRLLKAGGTPWLKDWKAAWVVEFATVAVVLVTAGCTVMTPRHVLRVRSASGASRSLHMRSLKQWGMAIDPSLAANLQASYGSSFAGTSYAGPMGASYVPYGGMHAHNPYGMGAAAPTYKPSGGGNGYAGESSSPVNINNPPPRVVTNNPSGTPVTADVAVGPAKVRLIGQMKQKL